MSKFSQLQELISSLQKDADKFYEKGNNAAGTRVRKGLQDVKNLSQDIRNEITAIKNKAR